MNEVEICNVALARMNAPAITSFDNETATARACKRMYGYTLDALLRDHNWSFATRQSALAKSASDFEDWEYTYAYPSDCVYIRKMLDSDLDDQDYQYVVRTDDGDEKVICTDISEAVLEYTMRTTIENIYDSLFIDALTWRLTGEFAMAVRSDTDQSKLAMGWYQQALGRAKKKDCSEVRKLPDEDLENPYLSSRI